MIYLSNLAHCLVTLSCKRFQKIIIWLYFSGYLESGVYMEGMMTVDLASSVILL